MRTRISLQLILKAAVVLLFCIGLAWSLRHRPGSKIDPLHAAQITPGMTLEQVVTILGDPPCDLTTLTQDELDYSYPVAGELRWATDNYLICMTTGNDGKVKEVSCLQSWERFVRNFTERPFWQRLKDWLGI